MKWIFGAIATVSLTAANANAQDTGGSAALVETVDECLAANKQSEFDTLAATAERISKSCAEKSGVIRLRGRGDQILGDLLRYNAEGRQIVWQAPLDMGNRFGGSPSPYDYNPVFTDKAIPSPVRKELKAVWSRNYWLIPATETSAEQDVYEATNGFGAKVEVTRRQAIRYGIATRIPEKLTVMTALIIPMEPERAREMIDNLDVVLSWRVAPACSICFRADTKVTGRAASMSTPTEERIENRYVFADITKIEVFDRTTGELIQMAIPTAPD